MPSKSNERFDERDTIFSRMRLAPGTKKYTEYYKRNPQLVEIDSQLRNAPPGVFSDREPENSLADATFTLTAKLRPLVRGKTATLKKETDAAGVTDTLKALASSLGAVSFGITESEEYFFYSLRGRGDRYGEQVNEILPFTIVMAFEMDKGKTATAPSIAELVEVARTYLDAAKTALALREFIGSIGYEAIAHIDGETELVMPPAAAAAGIGAIGRHGLIVHPKYGSRIRLCAVTTDLPLIPSGKSSFHIIDYCETCGACAKLCPKNSIPSEPADRNTLRPWRVNHESCYKGWTEFGSDCGVCLAACPFSGIGKGYKVSAIPGSPEFLKDLLYRNAEKGG